ncbi:unnamed protein product [Musa banksii]
MAVKSRLVVMRLWKGTSSPGAEKGTASVKCRSVRTEANDTADVKEGRDMERRTETLLPSNI